MEFEIQDRLRNILKLAHAENWNNASFSLKKAHVCAELSALVYEDVEEYELKRSSRIHLFASDRYRRIVDSGKPRLILSTFEGGGFDDGEVPTRFFSIRGRYAVVSATVFRDVVILAIRGTVASRLWDWKANINSKRHYVDFPYSWQHYGIRSDTHFFHKGFYEAIVPQFHSISDEIKKRVGGPANIVWTGHSLGGAMAAIGHAMSGPRSGFHMGQRWGLDSTSAYAFGMPRYGGSGMTCDFDGPFHIFNARDVVPTVPLRSQGFSDCSREFGITASGLTPIERTDVYGFLGHIPKLLSSIRAHSVEGYADSIAMELKKRRP